MSRLVKIERDQLGVRGGKGDLYVPLKHAQRIIEIVADEYDTTSEDLISHTEHMQSPLMYAACCVAQYALRQLTGASLKQIGILTGYVNHHSSVIHNLDQVKKKKERSDDYAEALSDLIKRIHAELGSPE